jgi:hypothetical protein
MSQEYLVVHDLGSVSGLTIVKAGKTYNHPIESWAIRSGSQVMMARSKLGKLLDKQHLGGSFEGMAQYGLSYEELKAVVTHQMGPSDRERYMQAVQQTDQVLSREDKVRLTAQVSTSIFETLFITLGHGIKFLAIMLIMPFIIMFFGKRK